MDVNVKDNKKPVKNRLSDFTDKRVIDSGPDNCEQLTCGFITYCQEVLHADHSDVLC